MVSNASLLEIEMKEAEASHSRREMLDHRASDERKEGTQNIPVWSRNQKGRVAKGGIGAERRKVRGQADEALVSKVIGHADGDLARPEEEGGLDHEGRLVVQEVFPPVGRDKLRQHHGQVSSIALTFHPVSMGPPGTPDARPAIRLKFLGRECEFPL